MRCLVPFTISIGLVASGYSALAQPTPALQQAPKADSVIRRLLEQIGAKPTPEVLITADRWADNPKEHPRQALILKNPGKTATTTPDALEQSAGAYVQRSQGGGGSIVLRGFEANRVLLVVDGVRMNTAIFRAGHLQNSLRIDPFALDRLEVLYGPGSVPYGTDALGGVVQAHTIVPRLFGKPTVTAQTRFASATNERTGNFAFSAPIIAQSLALSVTASASRFGDIKQGKSGRHDGSDVWLRPYKVTERAADNQSDIAPLNDDPYNQTGTGYDQISTTQKLTFRPQKLRNATASRGWDFTLFHVYTTSSKVNRTDRLSQLVDTSTSGKPAAPEFSEWYYGPETFRMAYGKAEGKLSEKTSLQFTLAYQQQRESRHNRRFNRNTRTNRYELVDAYSANLDVRQFFGERNNANEFPHELHVGGEYVLNNVISRADARNVASTKLSPAVTRYPEFSRAQLTGLYATHLVRAIPEKLNFMLGVRAGTSRIDTRFGNRGGDFGGLFDYLPAEFNSSVPLTSGQFGLVYNPSKQLKLSAMASTGVRAPNVDDLGRVFESAQGQVIVPNANLGAETATSIELGLQGNGKVGRLLFEGGLAVYQTYLRDAIGLAQRNIDSINFDGLRSPVFHPVNLDNAIITGFQANFALKLNSAKDQIAAEGNMGYQFGQLRGVSGPNTPFDHIPPMYGTLGLRLRHLHPKKANKPKTGDDFKDATFNLRKPQTLGYVTYRLWSRFNAAKPIAEYRLNAEDNEQYALPTGTPAWVTLNASLIGNLFKPSLELELRCENLLDKQYRTFMSGISAPGRNFVAQLRYTL